jgi:hypothetical protein
MLHRFVSASVVASVAIAFAAVALWIAKHVWTLQNVHQLAMLWCWVPLIWGVWALLTPRTWMPKRLPWWGAILGLLASANVLFVLNLPYRILGQYMAWPYRLVGVAIAFVGYYLLWLVVRIVYLDLRGPEEAEREFKTAA